MFRQLAASLRSERVLTEALGLWRSEPLANAAVPNTHRFHLWWIAEREALTGLHRQLLHQRVDQLWASPNDALIMARQLVALYPLDEWGHARVTQALNRCGHISEGRTYRATTGETLSLELGLPRRSVLADSPEEPTGRSSPSSRTRVISRPKLVVLPLDLAPDDDAARAAAMNIESTLALGLWQGGQREVADFHPPMPTVIDAFCAVCGRLTRLDCGFRLTLRCLDAGRGVVLWFSEFGPFQNSDEALTEPVGETISAIQSLIQTTEIRHALEHRRDRDRDVGDLLRQIFSLASSPEPQTNQRALMLLASALKEAPDDPLGLTLGAWCRVQRSIYQWSTNPESDRLDAKTLNLAASRLEANDPLCLTILGATRTMLADQNGARALLSRHWN